MIVAAKLSTICPSITTSTFSPRRLPQYLTTPGFVDVDHPYNTSMPCYCEATVGGYYYDERPKIYVEVLAQTLVTGNSNGNNICEDKLKFDCKYVMFMVECLPRAGVSLCIWKHYCIMQNMIIAFCWKCEQSALLKV